MQFIFIFCSVIHLKINFTFNLHIYNVNVYFYKDSFEFINFILLDFVSYK